MVNINFLSLELVIVGLLGHILGLHTPVHQKWGWGGAGTHRRSGNGEQDRWCL